MNYLAHLLLAGDDELHIVGNFLGDFIKGKVEHLEFPKKLKQGITTHRKVDRLADDFILKHLQQNSALNFQHRRFAGITFDLACDHFLAKNWTDFHPLEQHAFSDSRIHILKQHHQYFPERASLVLERIENYAWLTNYQNLDFLERVFHGIHQRFPRENTIDLAFNDLVGNYENLEQLCLEFLELIPSKLIEDQNSPSV